MEWTDESIARLRSLWQEGLSTAEIGRRMQITKNAVVGKAHRLDLTARPSPIRKAEAAEGAAPAPRRTPAVRSAASNPAPTTRPVALAEPPPQAHPLPVAEQPVTPMVAAPAAPAPVQPLRDNVRLLRPDMVNPVVARAAPPAPIERVEAAAAPAPRRRGLTCCWPLGEPGTKGFHFCGGEPTQGKPYCAEHAALAYVKLRDRRDSVA